MHLAKSTWDIGRGPSIGVGPNITKSAWAFYKTSPDLEHHNEPMFAPWGSEHVGNTIYACGESPNPILMS